MLVPLLDWRQLQFSNRPLRPRQGLVWIDKPGDLGWRHVRTGRAEFGGLGIDKAHAGFWVFQTFKEKCGPAAAQEAPAQLADHSERGISRNPPSSAKLLQKFVV